MNGVASFENSDGSISWKIRYRVPVVPGARRTRQKTETLRNCESRKMAEGVLASREAAIFNKTYRPDVVPAVRFETEVETFLAARKPADYADVKDGELAAWRSYNAALRRHLLPELGKLYMDEITPARLELLRKKLREARTLPDGEILPALSEASIRNAFRYGQSVFTFAIENGRATKNPFASISFKQIQNARGREPSDEECRKIATYILSEPELSFLRPVVVALYCTALRIQSILTLRWENIDLEAATATTKEKGGKRVTVHIPPLLVAELERWRPWSQGLSKSGWVFPSSRKEGGHTTQTAVSKQWAKMCAALEIKDLVRHDFRRRMQTALLRAGADGNMVRRGVGGASQEVLDKHYDARKRAEIAPLLEQVTDLTAISDDAKDDRGAQ